MKHLIAPTWHLDSSNKNYHFSDESYPATCTLVSCLQRPESHCWGWRPWSHIKIRGRTHPACPLYYCKTRIPPIRKAVPIPERGSQGIQCQQDDPHCHFNGWTIRTQAHEHEQKLSPGCEKALVEWIMQMGHWEIQMDATMVADHTAHILRSADFAKATPSSK